MLQSKAVAGLLIPLLSPRAFNAAAVLFLDQKLYVQVITTEKSAKVDKNRILFPGGMIASISKRNELLLSSGVAVS
jgi:hypothetical protein